MRMVHLELRIVVFLLRFMEVVRIGSGSMVQKSTRTYFQRALPRAIREAVACHHRSVGRAQLGRGELRDTLLSQADVESGGSRARREGHIDDSRTSEYRTILSVLAHPFRFCFSWAAPVPRTGSPPNTLFSSLLPSR